MNAFTVSEAAAYMGVHEQTIEEWIKDGKLKYIRFGKDRIFTKKSLNTLIMSIRSNLPTLEELANTFEITEDSMYYVFRMKYRLEQDAMNGKRYCYGEKKIRYVMDKEGWMHTRYKSQLWGVHIVLLRNGESQFYCIRGIEASIYMKIKGEDKRNIRPNMLYTKRQLAAMLEISPRTIERWISMGKIQPSGKTPGGEAVWNFSDAQNVIDEFHTYGWTMSEISFIFDLSYGLVNYIVGTKYRLTPMGNRNRARVYDPEDVKVVMEASGKMVQEVRIMRIDGSIGAEDLGWFVAVIDDDKKSLKVVTEDLLPLADAEDVAEKARMKSE